MSLSETYVLIGSGKFPNFELIRGEIVSSIFFFFAPQGHFPIHYPVSENVNHHSLRICLHLDSEQSWAELLWPVIVSVAQGSNWNSEGLPHRVERVLDHLRLVADGEPVGKGNRCKGHTREGKLKFLITKPLCTCANRYLIASTLYSFSSSRIVLSISRGHDRIARRVLLLTEYLPAAEW